MGHVAVAEEMASTDDLEELYELNDSESEPEDEDEDEDEDYDEDEEDDEGEGLQARGHAAPVK
jgi:hypothetical protein